LKLQPFENDVLDRLELYSSDNIYSFSRIDANLVVNIITDLIGRIEDLESEVLRVKEELYLCEGNDDTLRDETFPWLK
jgi:hypothetical protein